MSLGFSATCLWSPQGGPQLWPFFPEPPLTEPWGLNHYTVLHLHDRLIGKKIGGTGSKISHKPM